MSRRPNLAADPRTIARDVAGVFEAVFPQLVPAVVSHFNRSYSRVINGYQSVSVDLLDQSSLQRAMLFELAVVVAEQLLIDEGDFNWGACLDSACEKQQRYYDADLPNQLEDNDRRVVLIIANNLLVALREIGDKEGAAIVIQPRIPGYRWIASGVGDFATSNTIIEVKCSSKKFTTADYRQIVMYWLLTYISAIEKNDDCWNRGILLNPRLGLQVEFKVDDLISVIAFQRSAIAVVESFAAIIDEGPVREIM